MAPIEALIEETTDKNNNYLIHRNIEKMSSKIIPKELALRNCLNQMKIQITMVSLFII